MHTKMMWQHTYAYILYQFPSRGKDWFPISIECASTYAWINVEKVCVALLVLSFFHVRESNIWLHWIFPSNSGKRTETLVCVHKMFMRSFFSHVTKSKQVSEAGFKPRKCTWLGDKMHVAWLDLGGRSGWV